MGKSAISRDVEGEEALITSSDRRARHISQLLRTVAAPKAVRALRYMTCELKEGFDGKCLATEMWSKNVASAGRTGRFCLKNGRH